MPIFTCEERKTHKLKSNIEIKASIQVIILCGDSKVVYSVHEGYTSCLMIFT